MDKRAALSGPATSEMNGALRKRTDLCGAHWHRGTPPPPSAPVSYLVNAGTSIVNDIIIEQSCTYLCQSPFGRVIR